MAIQEQALRANQTQSLVQYIVRKKATNITRTVRLRGLPAANKTQWGLMATQNYTTQRRITFGLAFPSACYIVITKSYKVIEQDDSTYGDIGVNTFDKTGFYARNGRQKDLPGMYFALGK